ncbi:MAG: hypothetical protein AAFQ53_00250 [Bacteroidota bacterium]
MSPRQLVAIHAAHVERACVTWAQGPASDEPQLASMRPMLMATCVDDEERLVERGMVSRRIRDRRQTAAELGRTLALDGLEPLAVSQAFEGWIAPRTKAQSKLEVLVVSTTSGRDRRSVTTVREICRSVGGEAALGPLVIADRPGRVGDLSLDVLNAFRQDAS